MFISQTHLFRYFPCIKHSISTKVFDLVFVIMTRPTNGSFNTEVPVIMRVT